ncbi:MAG TPA: DUF1501 domain-containing protein, partial [Gemmataceae bacterium]|nr:DUF1501 domain-containing protein [Gemmataceae bacterium]
MLFHSAIRNPQSPRAGLSRRDFLRRAGLSSLALTWLLQHEGLVAHAAPKAPHFQPKAKAVIWLFMTGGPSQ